MAADDQKLQQIIENLLTNAIKFTPPDGSISFDAWVSPLAPPDDQAITKAAKPESKNEVQEPRSIIVSVSDTGQGLPEDQLSLIWTKFYRWTRLPNVAPVGRVSVWL